MIQIELEYLRIVMAPMLSSTTDEALSSAKEALSSNNSFKVHKAMNLSGLQGRITAAPIIRQIAAERQQTSSRRQEEQQMQSSNSSRKPASRHAKGNWQNSNSHQQKTNEQEQEAATQQQAATKQQQCVAEMQQGNSRNAGF